MIRHANFGPPFAVAALTIAVVELPFRALLMFAVGFTALLAAVFLSTTIAAITVAMIATTADVENRPTAIANAKSLPENSTGPLSHPLLTAGWTSGPPS